MGIFVRKTLLAALEIEGVKPNLGQSAKNVDHEPSLLGDIQRLHGELRELISQSLLSAQQESFDPLSDLMDELGLFEDEAIPDEESRPMEETEEIRLSEEEPIASSIKVQDPLNDLLDEGLKTKFAKSKTFPTKKEPENEPSSQSIPLPDETAKEPEEKAPKPKPRAPRSIPPDPVAKEDKTGFSRKSLPLSGNPPPKKPKH